MERPCRLEVEERVQGAGRDPFPPVGAADPVRELPLPVVVPARDRADHLAVELDRLEKDRRIAAVPFPARVERGAVSRIGRRERRHPERLIVGPMLEERVEVAVAYVPEHDHDRNAYLMWVTPGASTDSTCSSFASPTFSNSRAPPPSRIGTIETTISSSRPAARYCCAADAPPPRDTSFSPAAARAF